MSTPAERWKTTEPWRLPYSSRELISICAKGLEIPKVWTAHEFLVKGRLLILAIDRIAKLTQRRAAPHVARTAQKVFAGQLESVIDRAKRRAPGMRKPTAEDAIDILVPQHEAIWMQALDEVMKESGHDVVLEIVPPVQSVMAQGYSKVGILLGHEADPDRNGVLAREAQGIANKITRINDTTRRQFETAIRDSIEQGHTVTELAQRLRDDLLPMQHRRSLTVARTELNNAFTRGSATAFKESNTLATVSIIGCEAEEDNSPQYAGRSTCNFPNLPVTEIDAFLDVGFHVNHSGSMVPSSFREA